MQIITKDVLGKAIRMVIDEDNIKWIVAADLANLLEYKNAHDMLKLEKCKGEDSDTTSMTIDTKDGKQKMIMLNARGVLTILANTNKLKRAEDIMDIILKIYNDTEYSFAEQCWFLYRNHRLKEIQSNNLNDTK